MLAPIGQLVRSGILHAEVVESLLRAIGSDQLSTSPGEPSPPESDTPLSDLMMSAAMPDEPARAHLGRLIRLNSTSSSRFVAGLLTGAAEAPGNQNPDQLLHLMARSNGTSIDAYCRQHSMYPYRHAVTFLIERKYLEAQRRHVFNSLYQGHKSPRFCVQCAQEDLKGHGFSWFRRRHDIPGVDFCIVHGTALFEVDEQQGFLRLPHEAHALGQCTPLHPPATEMSNTHVFIQNYVCSFLALGNHETPLDKSRVAIVMARRSATAMGGASSVGSAKKVMEYLVTKRAPPRWLRNFSQERDLSIGLEAIERKREVANEYVALAMAALFDSHQEAMSEFTDSPIAPEFQSRIDRGLTIRRLVRDQAWPAYERNASCLHQLATGSAPMEVGDVVWTAIPELPGLDKSSIWRALKDFCGGSSVREACRLHDSDPKQLERILRNEAKVILAFVEKLQALSQPGRKRKRSSSVQQDERGRCAPLDDPSNAALQRFLANSDLWLASKEAGRRVCAEARDPKLAARQAREAEAVFAVWDGTHFLYPAFQFDQAGGTRPHLAKLVSALPRDHDGMVRAHAALWMFRIHPGLGNKTPADAFPSMPLEVIELANSTKPAGKR